MLKILIILIFHPVDQFRPFVVLILNKLKYSIIMLQFLNVLLDGPLDRFIVFYYFIQALPLEVPLLVSFVSD